MKILVIIILVLAGLLITGNLMTYTFQRYFILQPEKLEQDYNYQFDHPFEEVFLDVKKGKLNALHFKTKADTSKGVVLYFHGNAGNLQRWGNIHLYFTKMGYDFFIVDYRGYGKSRGRMSERQYYKDARTAYDHLRENYGPQEIIIYGRSLGSAVASNLATNVEAQRLILETPFSSMRELFYDYYPFLPRFFVFKFVLNNKKHIRQVDYPITIFQGTNDWIVPLRSAKKLQPHLKEKDEFIVIDGGSHNNLNFYERYNLHLERLLQE